jgi:hypothetical protein
MLKLATVILGAIAAQTIVASPVGLTGSGSYSWMGGSTGSAWGVLSASGTDGVDTVSIYSQWGDPYALYFSQPSFFNAGSLLGPCMAAGNVMVDGFYGNCYRMPNLGIYNIGGGSGYVAVYDASLSLLARSDVVAFITWTGRSDTYSNGTLSAVSASFIISPTPPTPEPAAAVLVLLGLGGCMIRRAKRGSAG